MLRPFPRVLVLAALITSSVSSEETAAADPEEIFRELKSEWDERGRKETEPLRRAEGDERLRIRDELFRRYRASAPRYASKFLRLAEDAPNHPIAVDALLWVVSNLNSMPEADRAVEVLTERYIDDPKVVSYILRLGHWVYPADEPLLRALASATDRREVRGVAMFRLGETLATKSVWARQLKLDPSGTLDDFIAKPRALGPGVLAHLESLDADALETEAASLFEEIAEKFADVTHGAATLGVAATRELDEMRRLAIGKPAPEVSGEDIDGVRFKLSDYRGKVVVLSFWGHW